MGIRQFFTKQKLDSTTDSIVESLSDAVAATVIERFGNLLEIEDLTKERTMLKKQVEDMKSELRKKGEDHARKEREIEHMVGLHQKRVEAEIDAANIKAKLEVREENLQHEREQFEKNMQFIEQRFNEQTTYLKEILKEAMQKVPSASMFNVQGAAGVKKLSLDSGE